MDIRERAKGLIGGLGFRDIQLRTKGLMEAHLWHYDTM